MIEDLGFLAIRPYKIFINHFSGISRMRRIEREEHATVNSVNKILYSSSFSLSLSFQIPNLKSNVLYHAITCLPKAIIYKLKNSSCTKTLKKESKERSISLSQTTASVLVSMCVYTYWWVDV